MTEEEIFELANQQFQWINDEGDIMEETLNSDDILEFAQKIADIAYNRGMQLITFAQEIDEEGYNDGCFQATGGQ